MENKVKINGFTLSEVLLVLSVIGVVAALTIPTLVQKASDNQYKVAWRKQFSALSQATNYVLNNDYGGNFFSYLSATTSPTLFLSYKKYMSIMVDCGAGQTNGGNCFHPTNYLSGGAISSILFDDGAFILNDGTMIAFEDSTPPNRYIWVDVNGIKSPNVLGKDVFGVRFYNDGVKPFGATGDPWENTCSTNGGGCSSEFLYK